MAKRRWTILIVPSDNEHTRSFSVDESTRKLILWAAGIAGAIVIAAVVHLFTPFTTPAGRAMLAENARLRAELEGIETRLTALVDTMAQLDERDRQLRSLVGLGPDSAAIAGLMPADSGFLRDVAYLPSAPARKPFLNRLGFGRDLGTEIDDMSRRAAALARSFRAVNDTLTHNLERIAATPSIMPTSGWLSSHFSASRLHPVLHENRPHEGIDVSAPMGAPIVAPAGGRVRAVGYEAGYGNTLEIDHGHGIITRYAHASRILVRNGQYVARGQLIATVGNTGLTIGPHLHYEVHVNGKPVDPLRYVLPDKVAD